jgi:ankyrin repeat protein
MPSSADPVAAFIEAACVPRSAGHGTGTLEQAEAILARDPGVARSTIYTAAILADEPSVRAFLDADPGLATVQGGPYGWDALTHLCFSRYLRLDASRSEAFVRTARTLLDAGANANTGWYEPSHQPKPVFESAIYGAAGVARHVGLTQLLLARGADPNDGETPYHVPETYDNAVLTVLLDSGRLNADSLACLLLRKSDWHDLKGVRILLAHKVDPNRGTWFGNNALQQAVRRDNGLEIVEAMLDAGADPRLRNREGRSAAEIAAHRGRGDVLALFEQRGLLPAFQGVDRLIAACARDQGDVVRAIAAQEPSLAATLVERGGTLLAEFAGVGNLEGIRRLLECGVRADALYQEGDGYFGIAKNSTALHVAAWRAWPEVVKELIARGVPVNVVDARGRTALALAVKACVDSYWTSRRSPDSVKALLDAGATADGITLPSGYDEVDALFSRRAG